jgi:hypothetical protein
MELRMSLVRLGKQQDRLVVKLFVVVASYYHKAADWLPKVVD